MSATHLSDEQREEIRAVLKLAMRCLAMIEETAPPEIYALREPVARSRIELSDLLELLDRPAPPERHRLRVVK